jgi:peptidoglycan/LPS O-acetylase OafA/YrhL
VAVDALTSAFLGAFLLVVAPRLVATTTTEMENPMTQRLSTRLLTPGIALGTALLLLRPRRRAHTMIGIVAGVAAFAATAALAVTRHEGGPPASTRPLGPEGVAIPKGARERARTWHLRSCRASGVRTAGRPG